MDNFWKQELEGKISISRPVIVHPYDKHTKIIKNNLIEFCLLLAGRQSPDKCEQVLPRVSLIFNTSGQETGYGITFISCERIHLNAVLLPGKGRRIKQNRSLADCGFGATNI